MPDDRLMQMDMRQYAVEQVTNLLARLAFVVYRARKSRKVDSIHDLRVAGRRFTQALTTFAPFFPEKETKKIRKRLRKLMDAGGAVRDRDVVLELARKLGLSERDEAARALRTARDEAASEYTAVLRKLARRDFSSRWRSRLALAGDQPPQKASQATVAKTARHALPLSAGRFFEQGAKAAETGSSPKELHEFRLATKAFRYSLELFVPAYGPALRKRLESLRQLQRLLGEINDCAVAGVMLDKAGAGHNKAVLDRLKKLEQARLANFRRFWTEKMDAPGERRQWIVYLSQFAGRGRSGLTAAAHA